MNGLLLFAHGSRDPRWAEPFQALLARVHERGPATPVVLGFLELMQPDFHAAAHSLAAQGCTRIDVLPLFLAQGGHLRRDLPALADAFHADHPGVEVRLHPAVGELDSVIDAMAAAALAFTQA